MGWLFNNTDEEKEERGSYYERNHQDDFGGWCNNKEYCRSCGRELEYKWDRCSHCHKN